MRWRLHGSMLPGSACREAISTSFDFEFLEPPFEVSPALPLRGLFATEVGEERTVGQMDHAPTIR